MMTKTPTRTILKVRGLSKTFPGQRALEDVCLHVDSGEIVAVVGQNGSGKSTLVKLLTGVHDADPGGSIEVATREGGSLTGEAARARIHVIHQDLGLIGAMTGIENLNLSARRRGLAPTRAQRERRDGRAMLARLHANVDLAARVDSLSPGERALLAIARALADWQRGDEILLLDEPTTALHDAEVHQLFRTVRQVAAQGAGVVFISHRLDEVLGLADRVIALRAGRVVADTAVAELDRNALVRMIVGHDLPAGCGPANPSASDDVVMEVRNLRTPDLGGVGFDIRAGEVLGLCGILGSGRDHVAGALFGARARTGEVRLRGRTLPSGAPRRAIALGVGYVPADRHAAGAVMTMRVRENLTLPGLSSVRGHAAALHARAERVEAARWAQLVALDPPAPERPLEHFSGGNQQKIVLAKWLRNNPAVLLLDEPTQGVDVGAKATVYDLILGAAAKGAAVLVSSSDTAELAAICDRVLVFRDGAIATEIARNRGELSEAVLVAASLTQVDDPALQEV